MELNLKYEDGQTPIDEDEKRGLKCNSGLTTKHTLRKKLPFALSTVLSRSIFSLMGNGRHSRLMGDILLKALDSEHSFTWGRKSFRRGDDRVAYIEALRKADAGNMEPLIKFSKE
ncbi:MAG: hypothetical protein IPL27_23240 [Lewinellaceae bacterium]|nr:hypothetical protein [Lewinellaceae bacterium]